MCKNCAFDLRIHFYKYKIGHVLGHRSVMNVKNIMYNWAILFCC